MADCWGTSLKFNNLRVAVGVTQQKPPSKYASHPYPVLVDEDTLINTLKPLNVRVTRSLIVDNLLPILMPLDVVVINVIVPSETYFGYGESYFAASVKPLNVVVIKVIKPKEIYKAYGTELLHPNIKPLAVKVKNLFQVISYNNPPEQIKFNIKPLNVVVTKT